MLKKIKSKLGFLYRGLIGIKDNIFDCPKVDGERVKQHKTIIGKTAEGRDIECYSFGKGDRKILYFGGIHGNEIGTVKLMNRWVDYLCKIVGVENFQPLQDRSVYIVPCLNLDGYERALEKPEYFSGGRYGKANANNVDLNRNFPTSNWSKESTLFAAGEYYEVSGGTHPGSEPEIQALLGLIKEEKIGTIYTFHNCWGTVFGRGNTSVYKKEQSYAKKSGYRVFSNKQFDQLEDGQKTGQMMVWASEQKIDVLEIETKTRWGSEWEQNKNALIGSLNI